MYFVYALYSESSGKIYIGYTSDIEKRLLSHNHPKNKSWTSRYRPWKIIYSEQCETKKAALIRERQLKSFEGRKFIRSIINC